MNKLFKLLAGICFGMISFAVMWVFFYVLADDYAFYLSRTNDQYASAEAVIHLFKICIAVSLLIALLVTALYIILFVKMKKNFVTMNIIYLILQIAAVIFIFNTDNFIPFLRETL